MIKIRQIWRLNFEKNTEQSSKKRQIRRQKYAKNAKQLRRVKQKRRENWRKKGFIRQLIKNLFCNPRNEHKTVTLSCYFLDRGTKHSSEVITKYLSFSIKVLGHSIESENVFTVLTTLWTTPHIPYSIPLSPWVFNRNNLVPSKYQREFHLERLSFNHHS